MEKNLFILVLLISISWANIYSQTPNLLWAKQMGGTGGDYGNSIVIDQNGNLYTTGSFSGTADFDPGTGIYNLTSAGLSDIFVSKMDASGNFIWAKRLGGTSDDIGKSIAIDVNGNIYTTGQFEGIADFDPGTAIYNLTTDGAGSIDAFISKLDASGNFIWAKQLHGVSTTVIGNSIAVDADENVYTTGTFYYPGADFDPGPGTYNLAPTSASDIFISKLDASGNFVWAKRIGGAEQSNAYSITLDTNGNVYTTGFFQGTTDFDPNTGTYNLISAGSWDIFVSKLTSSGNFVWAKQMGGTNYDIGKSIAVDANENVYTTGIFYGTADFDPGTGTYDLSSAGNNDIFISKLDASGNFVWAKRFGGVGVATDYDEGLSIAIDLNENVYSTGRFGGTADFDPGTGIYNLTSINYDPFVCKLDALGNFVWAQQFSGDNYIIGNIGNSICVDANGNVYTTGQFTYTTDFDPGTGVFNLTSSGDWDIFVLKLGQSNSCTGVSISTHPSNQTATLGSTASFSVTGSGTPPFTYKWKKNGIDIPGAGSDSYTTPSLTQSDDGNTYSCLVTNCNGNDSVSSNPATLTIVSSYNMSSSGTYTTCSGSFYDGGGPSGNYPINQDVTVTFYPSIIGAKLSITFTSFHTSDVLEVYNGNDTSAQNKIGNLFGQAAYGTITSTAADGSLTFHFISNNLIQGNESGWEATISCSPDPPNDITMIASGKFYTCGGNFYDGGGPNGDYMTNQNTIVTLSPPPGSGAKLSVTFISFHTSDVLEVYNGNDTSAQNKIGNLFGQAAYGTITSTAADGSLTFHFISNNLIQGNESGWEATISCSPLAPANISMIASGSFTTCGGNFYDGGGPGGNYMTNQNTIVTLNPSIQGAKLSVNFSSFQSSDPLLIYNGGNINAPLIATLTGNINPGTFTSTASDGRLTFQFISNDLIQGSETGWEATISCTALQTDITMTASGSFTTCGGNFYDGGGPNGNYVPNQNDTVTLYPLNSSDKLSVTFNSFQSDFGDTLFVYNGNSTASPLIGILSGVAGYGTITSTATDGSLTFKFVSDGFSNQPFEAGWAATIACNITPTDITMLASGTFVTCNGNFYDGGGPTGTYMVNQNVITTLKPLSSSDKLSVSFNSFKSDFGDTLFVYNGNSTAALIIGKLSGVAGYGTITSTATDGSLTFKFVSDGFSNQPFEDGWSATIACNITPTDITMLASGTFVTCSGNFYDGGGPTGTYMVNQNVITTLKPLNSSNKLSVTFNSFQSEFGDTLFVYNGNSTASPLLSILSGLSGNGTVTSTATDGSLTFKFVSDGFSNQPFEAGWAAAISCSGGSTTVIPPNLLWAKGVGGSTMDQGVSTAVDVNGNVYTTGYFNGTVDFDPGAGVYNLISSGGSDIFILKLDASGNFIWAKKIGGSGTDEGRSIAVDANGNILITGNFFGIVDLDPGASINNLDYSNGNIFILKLDPNGDFIWAKQFGNSITSILSMKLDASGNIHTTGHFQLTADFDTGPGTHNLSTAGNNAEIFVLKLNASGELLWAKQLGTINGGGGVGHGIAVDGSGNVYTTGSFRHVDFDPGPGTYILGSSLSYDMAFISKLDVSGNFVWAKTWGEIDTWASAITIDLFGNIFTTGRFVNTVDFDPGPGIYIMNAPGTIDIFVSKLDASGNFVWAKKMDGSINDIGRSLITDATGNVYTTGFFTDIADFDPGPGIYNLNSFGNYDIFISKLDPSGSFIWAINMGGGTQDEGNSITLDADGNIYLTGFFGDTADFDPGPGTYNLIASGYDIFVVKLGPDIGTTTVNSITFTNKIVNHTGIDTLFALYSGSAFVTNNPIKICADGSTSTYIKVNVSNTSGIGFRILDENNQPINDPDKYGQLGTAYVFGGNNVEVAYTHPQYMDANGISRQLKLQVLYNGTPISGISFPLDIYRAPIVFVHGFAGDRTTFEELENTLLDNIKYPPLPNSPLIHRLDYYSESLQHFFTNRKVVQTNIDQLFLKARSQNYSAGKVIIIGHSMGGILSRLYLQSTYENCFYRNDILKLITANTPHYGTQFANWGVNNFDLLIQILHILDPTRTISDGAIKDMRVNSSSIKNELNISPSIQNKVPSVTLSTNQIGDNSGAAKAIRTILYFTIPAIYYGETNDLIVPISSEQSGITLKPTILGQWHVGAGQNVIIMNQIMNLIDADPVSSLFTMEGFPTDILLPPPTSHLSINNNIVTRSQSTDSIKIINPAHGQIFSPNDNVNVNIYYSGNITRMALIAYGNSLSPITIDTNNVNQLSFQIPDNAVGKVHLILLGGDSTRWLVLDTAHILVSSNNVADSIVINPASVNLPLGIYSTIAVNGYFNGTQNEVNLMGVSGLSVQYDSTILSYNGQGTFRGIALGATNVVYTYQGRSDTSYFTIYNNPSVLTAAFDYSSDNLCANSSVVFQNQSLGIAVSYEWSFPGGNPSSSTQPNPIVIYSTPGYYSVGLKTIFINGVDSIIIDSLIYVKQLPTAIITPDGNTTFCFGDSVTLVAPMGMMNYLWSNGMTSPSIKITISGNYSVVIVDSLGCSAMSQPIAITVNQMPGQPGAITGNNTICKDSTQTYSVTTVPNTTSYSWTLPNGWTGTSTTNSIQVTAGSIGGTLKVKANNDCGSGPEQILAIIVNQVPVQPSSIAGNNIICKDSTQTYSVTTVPNTTTYTWTLPNGWTGTSTANSIQVTAGPNSGTLKVKANNDCGSGPEQTLAITVNQVPVQPGIITGSNTICKDSTQTYSIAAVPNTTSYTWTLPNGWTGTSTANSIQVTAGPNSGTLKVKANNDCGSGPEQTLAINVNQVPVQPGTITGSNTICKDSTQTYSVAAVPNTTSYTWTLPNGWSGTSTTNTIQVTAGPNNGTLKVKANNSCGSSTEQTLSIIVNTVPVQPGPISGNATICEGTTQTYSINSVLNATGYQWILPNGWIGSSTTNTIQVIIGASSDTIRVNAINTCGRSIEQKLAITVNPLPAQAASITGNTNVILAQTLDYSINSLANATTYNWQLSGGGILQSGQSSTTITIYWTTVGNHALSINGTNGCGNGPIKTLTIAVGPVTGIVNPDDQFQIRIVPNPSTGIFYLKAIGLRNKKIKIEILNSLGQPVNKASETVSFDVFYKEVDLRKFANGVYYFRITIDKKTYLRKAVKAN